MPRSTLIMRYPKLTSRRKFYSSEDETNEFTFSAGGQEGVNLQDAYKGHVNDLYGKNDPMFPGLGMKVTYVVQLLDKKYTKQKYAQKSKGTVSRAHVAKQVAQVVWDAMREENHWDGNHTTAPLRSWYLISLERVGKSSFACILGYEPHADIMHATIVDSHPRASQLPMVPATKRNTAILPAEPLKTLPPSSLGAGTTSRPATTRSQLQNAGTAMQMLDSLKGYVQSQLVVAANGVNQRDASPPSIVPSMTTGQNIAAVPVGQPQPQAAPPSPIFAASIPNIFSAEAFGHNMAPATIAVNNASPPSPFAYTSAGTVNPAPLFQQRRASPSPVAKQIAAVSLTHQPSAAHPSHATPTTETQTFIPAAGIPSDLSWFNGGGSCGSSEGFMDEFWKDGYSNDAFVSLPVQNAY